LKDISFSSSSRLHHQAVFIIKPFSSPSRSHHQAVLTIKPSPPSRPHHQAVLTTKPYYQATVASQPIKSTYQVILSSHPTKP
jgi:hypothetical protein